MDSNGDAEVKVCPLRNADAALVNDTWKYKSEHSLAKVQGMIESQPSVGVFVDGELVSWALTYEDGAIGMLFTLESSRGKGYGRLAAVSISKAHMETRDSHPFCFIAGYNKASVRLFEGSLGFCAKAKVEWSRYS